MYRRVQMKRDEFSMLSFTYFIVVNYVCQIADVVVPAGMTHDTIFWLRTVEMDGFLSLFSLPSHLLRQNFDKRLRKAMVH